MQSGFSFACMRLEGWQQASLALAALRGISQPVQPGQALWRISARQTCRPGSIAHNPNAVRCNGIAHTRIVPGRLCAIVAASAAAAELPIPHPLRPSPIQTESHGLHPWPSFLWICVWVCAGLTGVIGCAPSCAGMRCRSRSAGSAPARAGERKRRRFQAAPGSSSRAARLRRI